MKGEELPVDKPLDLKSGKEALAGMESTPVAPKFIMEDEELVSPRGESVKKDGKKGERVETEGQMEFKHSQQKQTEENMILELQKISKERFLIKNANRLFNFEIKEVKALGHEFIYFAG